MKLCPKPTKGMEVHGNHLPAYKDAGKIDGPVWCAMCGVIMKQVYVTERGYSHWEPASRFEREPSPEGEE